ncbi:hypothetical protein BASA61_008450 [Batrachochytrium salamandrivorans]|nr:hypothetical protein BASA61_008450 [Batrachochytrium salamandrivorans]
MVWTFPSEFKLKPFVVLHLDHVTYLEKVIRSIFIKTTTFRIASDCALVRTLAADLACPTSSKFRAMNSEFSSIRSISSRGAKVFRGGVSSVGRRG